MGLIYFAYQTDEKGRIVSHRSDDDSGKLFWDWHWENTDTDD